MTTVLLIAAAVAIWYYATGRRTAEGPGASADAWARRTVGPLHRLLAALGYQTRRSRQAAQRRAGAEGERRTAQRLVPLSGEGWTVLHDRRLPHGHANVDHLLISPTGRVILPDSKLWSAHYPLTVTNGRLMHGNRDVTRRLNGLRHEAAIVADLLGVPVTPLAVMDGPPIPAGRLVLDGVLIVPADQALDVVRELGRGAGTAPASVLASHAELFLPPYTGKNARLGQKRPGRRPVGGSRRR